VIKVIIPKTCIKELNYILDVLLNEFLGLDYSVTEHSESFIKIIRPGNIPSLTLNSAFFQQAHDHWSKPESMPDLPLKSWTPIEDGIEATRIEGSVPVLYGQPGLVKYDTHWHLNLDIFGSAFFMLSRYEELITPDRDNHDRFPATASIAYKANFLDRSIVNEYLEILWFCMHTLWPDLQRKERKFRKLISCDVDHPFDLAGNSLKRTILRIGARIFRDKNPRLALLDGLNFVFKKFGSDRFDEYRNNIDWMMEINKQAGNKVAFYFIPIQTDANREDPNDIRNKKISNLLKHIVNSGHEVGFHPGYNTYKFKQNFQKSADALKEACHREGVDTSNLGGRQHYLRFDISRTPRLWKINDFFYDSTLGFADKTGFRAGICYEYTMFDLIEREKLKLKQRPLIIMEGTIIAKAYEGLGYSEEAFKRFQFLEETCKKFQGDFTLLWHNSYFFSVSSKKLYERIVCKY
jgi:uncharacterized protein DUF7033